MGMQEIALISVVAVFLTTGCASTKQLVRRPDESAIALGKVQVQVRRPLQLPPLFEWMCCWTKVKIKDNNQTIGYLGPRGKLLWERDPGELCLEGGLTTWNMGDFASVTKNTEDGNRYNFNVHIPFWYPISRSGIELLDVQTLPQKVNK